MINKKKKEKEEFAALSFSFFFNIFTNLYQPSPVFTGLH